MRGREEIEIGRILHLKIEIRYLGLDLVHCTSGSPISISDFGFEVQDSSNFNFPSIRVTYVQDPKRRISSGPSRTQRGWRRGAGVIDARRGLGEARSEVFCRRK